MKLLFCFLVFATTCFATDYSQIDLIRHAKAGKGHAWLYYDWNTGKFFALFNKENSPKAYVVETMLDNSFLLNFKAAKKAFPFLKGYKHYYGLNTEDSKEMLIKNSVEPVQDIPTQVNEPET